MGFYKPPRRLTQDLVLKGHQDALDSLMVELGRRMDIAWQVLDLDRLDQTRRSWIAEAVQAIEEHQVSAADLAEAFCRDWSRLLTGQSMVVLRPRGQAGRATTTGATGLEQVLDALGPAGVKKRISQGIAPEAAYSQAREAVKAAVERRVLDVDRQTVIDSAHADPRATGWRRISRGGCKFCRMLAGRGEVYTAEAVRFAAHDNCRCTAAPAYGGPEVNVYQYIASKRKITDAQRAQLRDYLNSVEDDGVTPKTEDEIDLL